MYSWIMSKLKIYKKHRFFLINCLSIVCFRNYSCCISIYGLEEKKRKSLSFKKRKSQ